MIIDAHTHIGKAAEFDATVEKLAPAMQMAGVDYALVLAGEATFSDTLPSTEELIAKLDGRQNLFAIAAASPFTLTPVRLGQLGRYLREGKVKGVKLYPGYEHYYPSDERLTTLYRLAIQHGAPVIFHTGFFWDPRNRGLAKYANPLGVDEVATRFPELKIVIAHMGNPWIVECAIVVQKNPNVFADISGYFQEFVTPFSDEEKQMFRRDMERLHGLIGSYGKFLYGTDWPLLDMAEYVAVVESLNMTVDERDRIFWKNAAELFRIPTSGDSRF